MCIRDRASGVLIPICVLHANQRVDLALPAGVPVAELLPGICLLYTSDAADERSSVDLGGRRIIKKKTDSSSRDRHDYHKYGQKQKYTEKRS